MASDGLALLDLLGTPAGATPASSLPLFLKFYSNKLSKYLIKTDNFINKKIRNSNRTTKPPPIIIFVFFFKNKIIF